jgi:hypothetical protein
MNKQRKESFLAAAFLLILCLVFFGCENNPGATPGSENDPADSLVNPFIGVWKVGDQYWQFKTDGTGGKGTKKEGPFTTAPFSFFVYLESQFYVSSSYKQQSLVIFDDENVTRYEFSIDQKQATLTPKPSGTDITLEWVNGAPRALRLTNSLIGEYSATWYAANGTQNGGTWSIAYYTDGTGKFYHNTAGHQFQNSYALRGNKLVIYGNMRFGGLSATTGPIIATISKQEDGTLKITETTGIYYIYTKVDAATWKPD